MLAGLATPCYAPSVSKQEPDEQYTPRGERIPIPKREDFEGDLRKIIAAEPPPKKVLGLRRKRKDASPIDK